MKKSPALLPLSKSEEFCKVLLTVTFGFVFCFLFLMDYTNPEMNIFYRWSTTSQSALRHPVLFAIYGTLMLVSFTVNLDYLRRRYAVSSKTVAVLQYLGALGMLVTLFVKTSQEKDLRGIIMYEVHQKAAIVFGAANAFCLFGVILLQYKKSKHFLPFVIGGCIFIAVVIPAFIFKLCGFTETAPTMLAMMVLYFLNFSPRPLRWLGETNPADAKPEEKVNV